MKPKSRGVQWHAGRGLATQPYNAEAAGLSL